eukprot:1158591-Pelagomonas_calceolata.AAC.4
MDLFVRSLRRGIKGVAGEGGGHGKLFHGGIFGAQTSVGCDVGSTAGLLLEFFASIPFSIPTSTLLDTDTLLAELRLLGIEEEATPAVEEEASATVKGGASPKEAMTTAPQSDAYFEGQPLLPPIPPISTRHSSTQRDDTLHSCQTTAAPTPSFCTIAAPQTTPTTATTPSAAGMASTSTSAAPAATIGSALALAMAAPLAGCRMLTAMIRVLYAQPSKEEADYRAWTNAQGSVKDVVHACCHAVLAQVQGSVKDKTCACLLPRSPEFDRVALCRAKCAATLPQKGAACRCAPAVLAHAQRGHFLLSACSACYRCSSLGWQKGGNESRRATGSVLVHTRWAAESVLVHTGRAAESVLVHTRGLQSQCLCIRVLWAAFSFRGLRLLANAFLKACKHNATRGAGIGM